MCLLGGNENLATGVRFLIRTRLGETACVREFPARELTHGRILQLQDEDYSSDLAKRRKSYDTGYNCHGLVFAAKHGWVDTDEDIYSLLRGSGYRRRQIALNLNDLQLGCPQPPHVGVGDILLYCNPGADDGKINHSAIVVTLVTNGQATVSDVWVLSKFGLGGEYFHSFAWVPDRIRYGPQIQVWSDRSDA